jgi:hypothetical protein
MRLSCSAINLPRRGLEAPRDSGATVRRPFHFKSWPHGGRLGGFVWASPWSLYAQFWDWFAGAAGPWLRCRITRKLLFRSAPGIFAEVRGKGLMFGIDFRRPDSPVRLKAAWDALHLLNEGVFSQTVIMPLMHEHRILAQVAGYHTELIKFLPPLNIVEEDLDYFLNAMATVLAGLGNIRGSAWKTVRKLTRGAAAEFVR